MAYVKKKLPSLTHDEIQAYMLDPENNPLPEPQKQQFDRVVAAARLLDEYPDDSHIIKVLQYKFNCSYHTLRNDIELARQIYKTKHTFDWDFWFIWQIRDQLELIKECKLKNNLREWNNAKKVLQKIIGEKPEGLEDPNRMGRNQYFIQVNIGGKTEYKPVEQIQALRPNEVKEIIEIMQEPITDEEAEDIMNT